MFQPFGVIFRLIKYGIIQGTSVVTTYKPEDDPKGLKHVALLIVV